MTTTPTSGAADLPEALRSMIEGMSVSVDVSTGDHDAGHRYFGTVTEVMECQGDKHGVTLLVQDAEPNFAAPTPQAADSAQEDAARKPLQIFDSPRAKALMRAFEERWAACRDAEFVGEDAQNDAFNQSATVNVCMAEDWTAAAERASHGQAPAGAVEAAERYRNAIARARLLDSDLSNLTERGAKAWAGVDAQGLRDGGASPSANAGEPSAHIKDPYTLAEIKAKIDSNDYSAEMLLQHAMLLLDSVQEDAARYRFPRDGEWRDTDLEPFIRLQLNTLWDAKIDAARAAQGGKDA